MLKHLTPFLLHFAPEGGEGSGTSGGTDGSGGAGGTGTPPPPPAGGASAAGSGTPPPPPEAGKTLTQDEVNRIVAERVRRERAQFADYDSLKSKAEAYDAEQEAKKTNDQKAADAAAKAARETEQRIAAADRRLIAAEIKMQAAGKVHNPDHIVSLLIADAGIKVKGDSVEGVKEALEAFLADPANAYHLKKEVPAGAGAGRSGGEFSGRETKTLDEQIAEAEAAGDWKKSNVLKLQKMRAQA